MEHLNIWLAGGLISLGLIFILVAVLIRRHGQKKLANCTSKTTGQVYGYSAVGNGLFYPLVHFEVAGKTHKGKLTYRGIIVKASSFTKKTEIIGDKFALTLHVKRNSRISFNPLETAIPRGMKLDVYYNPKNPEENYIQRYAKSIVDSAFFICAILFILVGILFYFVI